MTRPLRARRLLAAAAVAPLLSAAVVACGSDDSGDPAGASGSSTSAEPATEELEEGEQLEPSAFTDIVAGGLEESTTARMTTTASFGGMELSAEGVADYTTSPPSLQLSMENPMMDGEMEVVVVDGLVYISLGQLTNGQYWKLDPSDPDSPVAGLGLDALLQQTDPVAMVQAMEPALEQVTYVGREDVDGRELDRYEVTADVAEAVEALGTQLPAGAGSGLPETMTYDLWLDEEDRFARLVMELPTGGGQPATTEMTLDDWGADVTIEAPPADEVTEMPDLGRLGGTSPTPTA